MCCTSDSLQLCSHHPQVVWCKNANKANILAVESDISTLHSTIAKLQNDLAAKNVVKSRLEERAQSLNTQEAKEAAAFQAFCEGYRDKERVVGERVRHAEIGLLGAVSLSDGLSGLHVAMRGELMAHQTKAVELQLDVAADVSKSYQLENNADTMLALYQQENKAALEKEKMEETAAYRLAVRSGLRDKAQKLSMNINELNAKIQDSQGKLEGYEKHRAELNGGMVAPWEFLCANAVGGQVAACTPRIRVQTSKENRKVWGGMDRELELPEIWNDKMEAEAVAEFLMLGDAN